MDFLNHLMIGFLISSWLSGSFCSQYIALGVLMAALPDFDLLLSPLGRRFAMAGHHGITHTFVFIMIVSIIIFFLYAASTGISDAKLLLIMLLAGSSHIFCDLLTNWGVPLLYPLKRKHYKLNLDMAVNPYLILYFFLVAVILAAAGQSRLIPLNLPHAASALGVIYLIYFSSRFAFKIHYSRRPENRGFVALPTLAPHRWKLAKRTESDDEIKVVIRGDKESRTYAIPKGRIPRIARCEDLPHTYWLTQVQVHMQVFTYPYYETDCRSGRMEIIWHSAEMGQVLCVHVLCEGEDLKTWAEYRRGDRTSSGRL